MRGLCMNISIFRCIFQAQQKIIQSSILDLWKVQGSAGENKKKCEKWSGRQASIEIVGTVKSISTHPRADISIPQIYMSPGG